MRQLLIVGMALVATLAVAQEWDVSQTEDIMAGTTSTVLIGRAEVSQATLRDAALVFRFDGEAVEAFVHWGGYTMERTARLLVRYGDDAPEIVKVSMSTSREAMFFEDARAALARVIALGPEGTVVIQAERNTGITSAARWIVGDLAETVEGL